MYCGLSGSSVHGISQPTGVSCHFFLQGIFLTKGLNLSLWHWKADSLPLAPQGCSSQLPIHWNTQRVKGHQLSQGWFRNSADAILWMTFPRLESWLRTCMWPSLEKQARCKGFLWTYGDEVFLVSIENHPRQGTDSLVVKRENDHMVLLQPVHHQLGTLQLKGKVHTYESRTKERKIIGEMGFHLPQISSCFWTLRWLLLFSH